MTILNRIASNWSFQEREKLNNNWAIIESYLSNLQGQVNILTGDVNVQDIVDQVNELLNQGNVVIADLETALQNATTVITNAQNATTDANNAAQDALNAINDMQEFINQFGNAESYDNTKLYKVNNLVEYDGSGFICIKETQGNPPPTLPTKRNEWWQLIAQKGLDGTGAVSKVAGKSPESDGNVPLTAHDVGAASIAELDEHLIENVHDPNGVHGLKIEGGTFTPILEGTTSIGNPTYIAQNGYYRLIEKMLFFDLTLGISDKGNTDGDITIRGLPFVPVLSNADRKASVTVGVAHSLNFTGIGKLDAFIELNGLIVPLITTIEGNSSMLSANLCGNNLFLRMSGTYEIQ